MMNNQSILHYSDSNNIDEIIDSDNIYKSDSCKGSDLHKYSCKESNYRNIYTNLSDEELEKRGLYTEISREFSSILYKHWPDHVNYDLILTDRPRRSLVHESRVVSWKSELKQRLDELRKIAADEDSPFSEVSLQAALAFVEEIDCLNRPSAFLLSNGNVRLLWLNESKEQIGLQFREGHDVQFIFFRRRGAELSEFMGVAEFSEIRQFIISLGMTHVMNS